MSDERVSIFLSQLAIFPQNICSLDFHVEKIGKAGWWPQRYSRNPHSAIPCLEELPEGRPPDCKVIPRLPSMTVYRSWSGPIAADIGAVKHARCVHELGPSNYKKHQRAVRKFRGIFGRRTSTKVSWKKDLAGLAKKSDDMVGSQQILDSIGQESSWKFNPLQSSDAYYYIFVYTYYTYRNCQRYPVIHLSLFLEDRRWSSMKQWPQFEVGFLDWSRWSAITQFLAACCSWLRRVQATNASEPTNVRNSLNKFPPKKNLSSQKTHYVYIW